MFTRPDATDRTALERQQRRIRRLRQEGIARSTVFVHVGCKAALDDLRPYLVDPAVAANLVEMVQGLQRSQRPTNVAQVRQLSPFRYPGGKTWLVPEVRRWITAADMAPRVFVEPFAGGAMLGLTAAAELWASHVHLAELDPGVSAVWQTVVAGADADFDWLCREILKFSVTTSNVRGALSVSPRTARRRAFRTIIANRMQRGGIMAPGAGLIKVGEGGRGLLSRWYPETLVRRMKEIRGMRARISFEQSDAFEVIERFRRDKGALFLIDPPYTASKKHAGRRLYLHNAVDHERLFALTATAAGPAMMTYDDDPAVRALAKRHGFQIQPVRMKNTHHAVMSELLILKR